MHEAEGAGALLLVVLVEEPSRGRETLAVEPVAQNERRVVGHESVRAAPAGHWRRSSHAGGEGSRGEGNRGGNSRH